MFAMKEISEMSHKEKVEEQIKCLKRAFVIEKKQMTVKEMSEYLKSKGFAKGSSEKTIYRRIIPKLEWDMDGFKKKRNYYYYNEIVALYNNILFCCGGKKTGRKTVITKEEIEEGIKTIQRLSLTKLISQDERKLIKKFLDFVKAQVKSNIEDCFVY